MMQEQAWDRSMSLRLRCVGIACFSLFLLSGDAARAITSQWCACVDGDGEREVWRLA